MTAATVTRLPPRFLLAYKPRSAARSRCSIRDHAFDFVRRLDRGDADAGCEMHRSGVGRDRRLRVCLTQLLRHLICALHFGFRQNDHEFVAAHPRKPIAGIADAAERTGNEGPEQFIARLVSETVVDQLEAVDIAAQDRQRMAVAAAAHQLTRQVLHEIAQVIGARQRIGHGKPPVLTIAGRNECSTWVIRLATSRRASISATGPPLTR